MDLNDTTALVTGAASGLGAATVDALLSRGVSVVGIDLPGSIEQATAKDRLTYAAADVTREDEVRAAIAAVGDGDLRLVVNCAGIGPSRRILSSRGVHDLEMFQRVIDINLVGTFNVLRLAAERMAAASANDDGQRGLIVNTASVAAFEGQIGQIAYSASKGGVSAMTIVAARDLARSGIRVNTIAPGIVETPMLATVSEEYRAGLAEGVVFPQRLARPEEFAQLVLMLAEHDYINGETVRMDGALRMAPQ